MSLAIPQGFRRGVLSVATILLFAWSLDSSQSWGIILLLIAVFPAIIYLAQSEIAQQGLGVSKQVAIWRLPFQALFIGLAYWHSKR